MNEITELSEVMTNSAGSKVARKEKRVSQDGRQVDLILRTGLFYFKGKGCLLWWESWEEFMFGFLTLMKRFEVFPFNKLW